MSGRYFFVWTFFMLKDVFGRAIFQPKKVIYILTNTTIYSFFVYYFSPIYLWGHWSTCVYIYLSSGLTCLCGRLVWCFTASRSICGRGGGVASQSFFSVLWLGIFSIVSYKLSIFYSQGLVTLITMFFYQWNDLHHYGDTHITLHQLTFRYVGEEERLRGLSFRSICGHGRLVWCFTASRFVC